MPYTQTHAAETLAELATRYIPEGRPFIADFACPITPTRRKLVKFWKGSRADAGRITDSEMAPEGMPNRRTFSMTSVDVEVKPYGLHDTIPVSDLNDPEPGIDLESDTVEYLTHDLLMGHEKRVADLIMTAGNYASANKVTLGTPWTSALSTPVADILTGIRACAVTPNRAFCDETTFHALCRHPEIISTLRGVGGAKSGLATEAEIASYFGLDSLHVGKVKYNSANPTATESYTTIWPTGRFLLAKVVDQPRAREVTLARAYRFAGNSDGLTFHVESIVDPKPGTQGVLFQKVTMEEYVGHVATDVGYLISSAAS